MSEGKLTTTVRKVSPFACVIDIQGEISSLSDKVLSEAYEQAIQGNIPTVIFNFQGLTYMNSLGIGTLVTLVIHARRQGKHIAGYGLNDHYRSLFNLTRIDQVIPIYSSQEIALASVNPLDLPERES